MSRLLVVALLVALTACTASGEAPPQESSIDVSMGFTQLLPDEGTPKGLLRVVNEGVKPGDWVIVNGLQHARPGSTVKPVRDTSPPAAPTVDATSPTP